MSEENEVMEQQPDWTGADGAQKFGGDANKLWESYRELESYRGNSIRIPSQDASEADRLEATEKLVKHFPNLMYKPDLENPEENREFMRTIGLPESPDKYMMPEGISQEDAKDFAELAHNVGLTNRQFQELTKAFHNMNQEQSAAYQQQVEEGAARIKEMWGMATDDNIQQAAKFADMTKAPEIVKQAMSNPEVMSWVYGLSKNIGEGSEVAKQQNSPQHRTPAEAEARLSEIYNNSAHPFFNQRDPGHAAAIALVTKLMQEANPKSSTDKSFQTYDSGRLTA